MGYIVNEVLVLGSREQEGDQELIPVNSKIQGDLASTCLTLPPLSSQRARDEDDSFRVDSHELQILSLLYTVINRRK